MLDSQYFYNKEGIRTKKIVNGVETNYFLENSNILFEETKGNVLYYMRTDENDLIGFQYNNETYYYKKNYQGDILGIYNSNYELECTYEYDSYGSIVSIKDVLGTEIEDENHIGNINPYRYISYYYDKETKLYYLNSRYYNPLWGRFINADGIIGTSESYLGYNLYAYCENNSINFNDSFGTWKQVTGGWQAQKGDTLWGLASMLTGKGSNWKKFGYSGDPRKLQIGTIISSSCNVKNSTSIQFAPRDVSLEVNKALSRYASIARATGGNHYYSYMTFYKWGNHEAAWDIKRAKSWVETIGTTFPGVGTKVKYNGMLMTPEQLGNYTYGYLGAAFGFSLNILYACSFYAGGHFHMNSAQASNEFNDWMSIRAGYYAY